MSDQRDSLERRVDEIEAQVNALSRKVDALTALLKMADLSSSTGPKAETPPIAPAEASERVLAWVGQASLLQRLATICFLMVVALILRTVTDNNIIDQQVGSLLGMTYASVLIALGWHLYRRSNPLAPVFAVSGALLMFLIVLETHEHFESLPTVPAYVILTFTGAAMAAISHLFRVALPVFVGALGMSLAGVALDFPHPVFPYLVVLLLVANILGAFATRLQRCTWLRGILLAVTLFMMLVWAFRLGTLLTGAAPEELPFSVAGFFPAVVGFGLAYLIMATMGILGRITERVSKFDYILPTINAVWSFAVARYAVNAGLGDVTVLGIAGVAAALGHLGVAYWLGSRNLEGARGTNSLTLAGAILLLMALPAATGSKLMGLMLLSAAAFGLAVLSRIWRSGGVRLTSYLAQIYACGALALLLRVTEMKDPSLVGAAASGALACIALGHYLWARNYYPPRESVLFTRFDKNDRSAAILLLASLVSGFFTLRVGLYQALLQTVPGEELAPAFACTQTVLINVSAAVLMCVAFARRNKEIRNVAILVTILGGGKVFLVDLFGIRGLPVVVSVLSFGLAAAIESFALTRWQRLDMLRVSKWPREENAQSHG